MINEEKRKKDEGATLPEKIEKLIEKIKKKDIVSHMNDTFYEECVDSGVVFYLRRTDLQREDGRHKCIVDKIELAEKEKNDFDCKEAARDQSYEEFKEKYVEHIEGCADNARELGEDSGEDIAADAEGKDKPMSASRLKKSSEMSVSGSQRAQSR